MDFHEVVFFTDKGKKGPIAHVERHFGDQSWPISMKVNQSTTHSGSSPRIKFFMTEQAFVNFKNSVIAAADCLDRQLRKSRDAALEGGEPEEQNS